MTPALSPRKPRPVLTGAPPGPQGECSVRVVARFRPPVTDEERRDLPAFRVHPGGQAVEACDGSYLFELDRAFSEAAAQDAVYDDAGQPAVEAVLGGYNGTVMAYGQTGGGKTFTMFGPMQLAAGPGQAPEEQGVVPRATRELFQHMEACAEDSTEFTLRCSFLEVHREQMRDLLNPTGQKLAVKELPQRGLFVAGLSREFVSCPAEVLSFLRAGSRLRAVARTRQNQNSSRSHAVFAMHLEQRSIGGTERLGKLTLVDLAGSEKAARSGCAGESLEDAKKINWSLSALGKVIDALAEQRPHVPYRDSQLTRVLEEALGGNCRTTLVVAASACSQHCEETLSALRFATRAKNVRNHARVNYVYSCDQLISLVAQLQRELASARRQLASAGPGPARPLGGQAQGPEAEMRLGPSGSAPSLGLGLRRAAVMAARGMQASGAAAASRRRRAPVAGGDASTATPTSSASAGDDVGSDSPGPEPEEQAWRPLALAARDAARPLEAALAAQEVALGAAGLLPPAEGRREGAGWRVGELDGAALGSQAAGERVRALRQLVSAHHLNWRLQLERHRSEGVALELALRKQYIDELEWSLEESTARLAEMRHDASGLELDPARPSPETRGAGPLGGAGDGATAQPAGVTRAASSQLLVPGRASGSLAKRGQPQLASRVLRRSRTTSSMGLPVTPEQGRRDGAAAGAAALAARPGLSVSTAAAAPAPAVSHGDAADAAGGLAHRRPPSGDVGGTEAEQGPGAAAPAASTGDTGDPAAAVAESSTADGAAGVGSEEARARLEALRLACGALEGRAEQLQSELALRGEQLTQLAAELAARGVRTAALRHEAAVEDALLGRWHNGLRRTEGDDEAVEALLEQALSPLAAILTREQTAAASAAGRR